MFRRMKMLGGLLALGLATTLVSACGSGEADGAGAEKIVYTPPGPGALNALPVAVAIEKGYFKEEGFDVEQKIIDAKGIPAGLVSGAITFSMDVYYNVARYEEQGVSTKIISGLAENNDWVLLRRPDVEVAPPGPGPDGWKDTFASLKGMKIGQNSKGGPIGLSLAALLKEAGVQEGDYTLVDTPSSTTLAAMSSKQVDVVLAASGREAPIENEGYGVPVLRMDKDIANIFGNQPNVMLFTTDMALEKHPGLASGVQKAIQKAIDYIADPANLEDVMAIAKKDGAVDVPQLGDLIQAYTYESELDVDGIQSALDWAKRAGMTTENLDAESFVADGVETK